MGTGVWKHLIWMSSIARLRSRSIREPEIRRQVTIWNESAGRISPRKRKAKHLVAPTPASAATAFDGAQVFARRPKAQDTETLESSRPSKKEPFQDRESSPQREPFQRLEVTTSRATRRNWTCPRARN